MKSVIKYSFASLIIIACLLPSKSFSQQRLPDGTIIYQDGSRRLPNGTITYPNGRAKNTTGVNRTIDGILHPDRNNTAYPNRYPRRNNGQGMPPGQAKKIYGGNASDYAPGHNKGRKNYDRRDDDNENEHGHGNGKGHGNKKHDKD